MKSINITTTHSRLDLCSSTIWSLMHQSILPERINLWISHEAYMADKGITEIPEWYNELNRLNDILRIYFVENTGPYRKIIPILRMSNDEDIITYADDDVIYGKGWYESLLMEFTRNEGKYIVATRVRMKRSNIFGRLQSYNMFELCKSDSLLNKDYIVTGVGGCILSIKNLKKELIFLDDFTSVSSRTDDVWLSKIFELSKASVFCKASSMHYVQEIKHNNNALNDINNVKHSNGVLKKIIEKIKYKIFGYFGKALSNNDVAIRLTDNFFCGRNVNQNVKK